MKQLLLVTLLALSPLVNAGPPEGMERQMIQFPAVCLPATVEKNHFAVLMDALIKDYGVHISMTFSATPDQSKWVAIIENPHSGLVGVLMVSNDQTCIAFSGEDRQVFVRPLDHPIGKMNEDTET